MAYCLDTTCSILLNSRCVYYESSILPNTGINTNDSLQVALQKIDEAIGSGGGGGSAVWGDITGTITDQTDLISLLGNYVPETRTLTINGTSLDLSNDRAWNVGVVTSIGAGTGISVGGTSAVPIITNTAPDQVVSLSNGTGISISGTYPSFTITNTAPSLGGDMILASAQTSTGKKSFTSNGTNAGLRFLPFAGNPSGAVTGDAWFNSTEDALVLRTGLGINMVVLVGVLGGQITNGIPIMVGNSADGVITTDSSFTFTSGILSAPELVLSGQLRLQNTASDTGSGNGRMWYNTTSNTFKGIQNTSYVNFLTDLTPVTVTQGGTGLSTIPALSIWVADTLNTITSLIATANQSIRVNAGGTAWEVYTPGSGGITNSAANNELMKSNGTNAVPSGLGNPSLGFLDLGLSGTSGTSRQIQCVGSGSNLDLLITAKGTGSVSIYGGSIGGVMIEDSSISSLQTLTFITQATGILQGKRGSSGNKAGKDLIVRAGDGYTGGGVGDPTNGGNLYFRGGLKNDTGTQGNIGLFTESGSFGSGQQVLFIANAVTNASVSPTNGMIIHARDSSDGAANSTLALYTEQGVEAIGAFTASHKLKVWINNVEYWISLDAV